jgi:hypothetical protein
VLAVAGRDFSLSANQASSIAATGRNLKFLVSDPNAATDVAATSIGVTTAGLIDDDLTVAIAATGQNITITDNDFADSVVAGQRIILTANLVLTDANTPTSALDNFIAITANTVITVGAVDTAANTVVLPGTFAADYDFTENAAQGGVAANAASDTRAEFVKTAAAASPKILSGVRNTATNTYVIDSGLATNTGNKVLVLENLTSTATVAVDVTAWVDDNGNGAIDTTEYASPKRTVAWVGASTVVPTVTWTPVVIGDETMTATVTLSPTINFDQEPKASFEVDMDRQGSSASIGSDDSSDVAETWDSVDQDWTIVGTLKDTNRASVVWTGLKTPTTTPFATGSSPAITHYAKSGTTVTITTAAAHNLSVNDTVTVTGSTGVAASGALSSAASSKVTAASDLTFSYTTTGASATVVKTAVGTTDLSVALIAFGFATAGEYKATVKLGGTPAKIGATSVIAAGTQVSAGVENKATVTPDVSSGFSVRAGTVAAVQVTSSVTTSTGLSVGAGIPVSIAVTETSTGIVTVNGTTVTTSKTINTTTDANGKVVISVTNSSGLATQTVALAVSSQGFSDTATLTWAAAAYALTDSNDNASTQVTERSISVGGEVAFNLSLKDQWGAAPAGEFRIKAVGAGTRYDFTTYESMSNGSLNWTLSDAPVSVSTMTGTVTYSVQQKNSAGSWVTPDGTAPLVALTSGGTEIHADAITINVRGANGTTVTLNADAISDADLSVASTVKALVAADTRNAGISANDVSLETGDVTARITGTIKDKFTGVAQPGSLVTFSGNSAILFSNGVVESFGSFSMVASATGTFTVNAFSNSGLTDSVVTVTSNGASSTVKVSFTGSGSGSGNIFTITAPASAMPGTTFQVKGKLADSYGNGVTVAAPDIKVTYTGPGLVVGTLPTATDAFGEFVFSVLLGSNDSGSAVITASYDQGSDDDFTGTAAGDLDIVVSKTVVIGAAISATKITVGTYKGYVAVFAKGYEGQKLSVRLASKWHVVAALADLKAGYALKTINTGVGYEANVIVYIDGVEVQRKTITTK